LGARNRAHIGYAGAMILIAAGVIFPPERGATHRVTATHRVAATAWVAAGSAGG